MRKVFLIFNLLVICNISFQSTLPLILFAPVEAGGLDVGTSGIGVWYAVRAGVIILIELPSPSFRTLYPTKPLSYALISLSKAAQTVRNAGDAERSNCTLSSHLSTQSNHKHGETLRGWQLDGLGLF